MSYKSVNCELRSVSRAPAPFKCVASARIPARKQAETTAKVPGLATRVLGAAAAMLMSTSGCSLAAEKVAEFTASGVLFKDSVNTIAIDDPDVKGVTIYVSDFERNLADKITKMGSEPSSASVTCAVTGPIEIQDIKKVAAKGGEEVFSEKKGLNFVKNKTLRVRRIFDEKHKTLLYVAYSTRFATDKDESPGRFKTSICALPISSTVAPVAETGSNKDGGLFSQADNSS